MTLYYRSCISNRSAMQPIPEGFQMLAKDTIKGSSDVVFITVNRETIQGTFIVYEHGSHNVEVDFLDFFAVNCVGNPFLIGPGGTRHVAYSSGQCSISYFYRIPVLTQIVRWDNISFHPDWRLTSDITHDAPIGSTIHADYVAGWTPEAAQMMFSRLLNCYRGCSPEQHFHTDDQYFARDVF